jgi:hypothetical protein
VKLQGEEGQVVDYSMVQDSVLVQFGQKRSDRRLVPLGRLAPENPGIEPADPEEWIPAEPTADGPDPSDPPDHPVP